MVIKFLHLIYCLFLVLLANFVFSGSNDLFFSLNEDFVKTNEALFFYDEEESKQKKAENKNLEGAEEVNKRENIENLFNHSLIDFPEKMQKHILFKKGGANVVGYLKIEKDRPIDQTTFIYIKFALEEFKKQKVSFVILDLDTPGGEVIYALKIADLLRNLDMVSQIPVIAYVDNWAISAGALLAYSCRFISVQPSSIMGAAEPIYQTAEKVSPASEKANSALRAEFANTASFFGRDPLIAKAMVDKDVILVQRGGEITELVDEKEIKKEDQIITTKGKLLTLTSNELLDFKIADFMVSHPFPLELNNEEKKSLHWPAEKSALFEDPFLHKIPNASVMGYSNWKVSFFSILTHPVFSSLLLIGFFIGLYGEIATPGFGIFGVIALICLASILISNFAVYAMGWIELIILCLGVILVLIEAFLIPGFGFTGIMGILLCIVGLFALMLPSFENFSFFDFDSLSLIANSLIHRIAWLFGGLMIALFIIVLLARFVSKKLPYMSKLVLQGEGEITEKGYISGFLTEKLPKEREKGVAYTPLRPSGKILINEDLYDAITEGGFIEKNESIIIERIIGSKIIVSRLK